MDSAEILTALETVRHYDLKQWLFLREVRCGTGFSDGCDGRIDAWAMNCYNSKRNERIAYEVKVSRSDFTREIAKPHKRKIGLLFSNRFYFVTPPGILDQAKIPPECGLIEVHRYGSREERLELLRALRGGGMHISYREITPLRPEGYLLNEMVFAPQRAAFPMSCSFVASLLRNAKRMEVNHDRLPYLRQLRPRTRLPLRP